MHRNTRPSGADAMLFLEVNIEPVMSVLSTMSSTVKTETSTWPEIRKGEEFSRIKWTKKRSEGGDCSEQLQMLRASAGF